MEIEEAFTAYLLAQTGLTALISNRFYPDEAPQNEPYPYVYYFEVSNALDHFHGGQSSLEQPNIQFTICSKTKAEAKAVAKQIKAALYNKESAISGITIQYIKLVNELCSKEKSSDGLVDVFALDLEYEINYIRSGL